MMEAIPMAHVSLQLSAPLIVPIGRSTTLKRNWRLRAFGEALREPGTEADWLDPGVVPWLPRPGRPARGHGRPQEAS